MPTDHRLEVPRPKQQELDGSSRQAAKQIVEALQARWDKYHILYGCNLINLLQCVQPGYTNQIELNTIERDLITYALAKAMVEK